MKRGPTSGLEPLAPVKDWLTADYIMVGPPSDEARQSPRCVRAGVCSNRRLIPSPGDGSAFFGGSAGRE